MVIILSLSGKTTVIQKKKNGVLRTSLKREYESLSDTGNASCSYAGYYKFCGTNRDLSSIFKLHTVR